MSLQLSNVQSFSGLFAPETIDRCICQLTWKMEFSYIKKMKKEEKQKKKSVFC